MSETLAVEPDHELKTWPEFFQAVVDGRKTFEVRKDDRDFGLGDILLLREWEPGVWGIGREPTVPSKYTGREARFVVTYALRSGSFFGMQALREGYVVLGIKPVCASRTTGETTE